MRQRLFVCGQVRSAEENEADERDRGVCSHSVRDGLQGGYEPALQRYYGYQSFADLEQHWLQYAFGDRLSAGASNHTP